MSTSSTNPDDTAFVEAVAQTITRHRMFSRGDRVLIGVSGGPDSVALVIVLMALASKLGLSLGVAHLDHGLRGPAAERDAAFVTALARQKGLPCHLYREDVHAYSQRHRVSIEVAGRRCRYAFFKQVAASEKYHKTALGHHADDNAELVLMNILRGSGPQGLTGIPAVRAPWIVRPLIDQRRTAILAYLRATGTNFVEDETNQDPTFLRNRIRHQLLPALKDSYNPNIISALNRLSAVARDEEAWLVTVMQPLYDQALVSDSANRIALSLPAIQCLPVAAQKRLLRMALKQLKGELRRISHRHIRHILALASKPRTGGRLDLPDRIQIVRRNDLLECIQKTGVRETAKRALKDRAPVYEYSLPSPKAPRGSLSLEPIDGVLQYAILAADQVPAFSAAGQKAAFFDMDKLQFPLLIRNIQPGDRFRPLGAGGSQKIKKYLIDHKIPRSLRRRTPVLVSNTRIAWLAGFRIDDTVKVDAATQTVFKCELLLA